MRLYIAGPMTGIADYNYPAFHAAAVELGALGYETENPADNDDGTERDWVGYMLLAIPQMLKCDGIALLDGWENSRGASLEAHIARDLGRPVLTLDEWINPTANLGQSRSVS